MNGASPRLASAGVNQSARSSRGTTGATGRKSSRSFSSFRRACIVGLERRREDRAAPSARGPNSMRPWNQPMILSCARMAAVSAATSSSRR